MSMIERADMIRRRERQHRILATRRRRTESVSVWTVVVTVVLAVVEAFRK